MMTWRELTLRVERQLAEAGVENARYDARELTAFVGEMTHTELLTSLSAPCTLDAEELARLDSLTERRTNREPLQYLVENWDFYGRSFDVGPGVLIPRQDTETLVDEALKTVRQSKLPSSVAYDLCAGSGCIGITLYLECRTLHVVALEWSNAALFYLKNNVSRMAPSVEVHKADVLSVPLLESVPKGGLVVSNPPYIKSCDLNGLSREVKCEPAVALDGGEDGLRFYRVIAAHAPLLPGGRLLLEIGAELAEAVTGLLLENGYTDVCVTCDLNGLPRVVSGTHS